MDRTNISLFLNLCVKYKLGNTNIEFCCGFCENKIQIVIINSRMLSTKLLKLGRKIKIECIRITCPNSHVSISLRSENPKDGRTYLKTVLHCMGPSHLSKGHVKFCLAFFICKTYTHQVL